jgi:hypothetical protein
VRRGCEIPTYVLELGLRYCVARTGGGKGSGRNCEPAEAGRWESGLGCTAQMCKSREQGWRRRARRREVGRRGDGAWAWASRVELQQKRTGVEAEQRQRIHSSDDGWMEVRTAHGGSQGWVWWWATLWSMSAARPIRRRATFTQVPSRRRGGRAKVERAERLLAGARLMRAGRTVSHSFTSPLPRSSTAWHSSQVAPFSEADKCRHERARGVRVSACRAKQRSGVGAIRQ